MDKTLSLKAIVSNDVDKSSGQATIYLLEEGSQTILPINVDLNSAEAILLAQQNLILPRPHTHDLIKRLINCFNGKLIDVLIYDLQEDIFYAYLRILHGNEIVEIDTRPSDAVALATRHSVPILVKEEVLVKGGIKISENLVS